MMYNKGDMKIFFLCSSEQGQGYVWGQYDDFSISKSDGVDEEIVSELLSISSMNFFVYKNNGYSYLVQKRLPYPYDDYEPLRDISLSKIYINLVMQFSNDELARRISMFMIGDFHGFSKLCYSFYNPNDNTTGVGYSFKQGLCSKLIDTCSSYRLFSYNDENKLGFCKINQKEAIGRIAGYNFNYGVNIGILDIEENEYKERFTFVPTYILREPLSVSNKALELSDENVKMWSKNFSEKKNSTNDFVKKILIGIVILVVLTIVALGTLWGTSKDKDKSVGSVNANELQQDCDLTQVYGSYKLSCFDNHQYRCDDGFHQFVQ